jgi:hypothetical protein
VRIFSGHTTDDASSKSRKSADLKDDPGDTKALPRAGCRVIVASNRLLLRVLGLGVVLEIVLESRLSFVDYNL